MSKSMEYLGRLKDRVQLLRGRLETTQLRDPQVITKELHALEWAISRLTQPEAVSISQEMLDFLHGRCALDGVWFGDKHPKYRGRFWWRALLPDVPTPQNEKHG